MNAPHSTQPTEHNESLRAFELVCIEFEVPETREKAEATLLQFRKEHNTILACRHVLEHSQVYQARFQAVLAMREAALRNWGSMSHAYQLDLRSYMLQYILRHTEQATVILSALTGALAALVKRGWREATSSERQAFFSELEGAVQNAGDPQAKRLALEVLNVRRRDFAHHIKLCWSIGLRSKAIVLEFSPATASPLGQTWHFHEECRGSLEQEFLQSFFVHAVTVAQEAAPAAATGGDTGVCLSCIQLLTSILQWEFRQALDITNNPVTLGASCLSQYSCSLLNGAFWSPKEDPVIMRFVDVTDQRWDQLYIHPSAPQAVYGLGRPSSDSVIVKPGKAWRHLLLAPEATQWLVQLLSSLRGHTTPLAAAARDLLVMLCSVTGDVFPQPNAVDRRQLGLQAKDDERTLYLRRLLKPVVHYITPAHAALQRADASDEAELCDACRAIAAAAMIHRAEGFEAAVPRGSDGAPEGALGAACALTEACVAAGGTTEEAQNDWPAQVTNTLLDAWIDLVAPAAASEGEPSEASQRAAQAAGVIFKALVKASLKEFAAGAFDDEAEGEAAAAGNADEASEREQAFARAAALARASVEEAMLLLSQLIHERLQKLQQCVLAGSDTSITLEELCWLLRMAAHVAADPGEGETPLPPTAVIAACSAACTSGRQDALDALSHSLLALVGLCLDQQLQVAASPRLMEAAVWAVSRWADTYLLPIDSVSPAMESSFGGSGSGTNVLRVLTLIGVRLLGGQEWAGEVDLHRVVVLKLLAALVRRRTVCSSLMMLEEWQQLAGAFADQREAVKQLAGSLQRAIAKILCQASVGLPDVAAVSNYVTHLMHKVAEETKALSARQDLKAFSDRPDVSRRIDGLISALRGAAAGCSPRPQTALWRVTHSVLGPLLTIARAFHNDAAVTCSLLKLAGEVAEAHISYLTACIHHCLTEMARRVRAAIICQAGILQTTAADASALCNWVLQLLKQYSLQKSGQVSMAATKQLRDEAVTETYRDLKALLRLLTQLTNRDLADFNTAGEAANGHSVDIAQVIFLGLEILVPLMRDEQLMYPKLAREYFTLLSYMLEVYPERVASCAEGQMQQILATLRWGICSSDLDVAQPSLEALAALARFLASAISAGHQQNASIAGLQSRLSGFLEAVLQRLLMEEDWREVVDAAADCLLPLMMTHQPALQQLGGHLVGSCSSQEHQAQVSGAFSELLGSNGVTAGLDRANRRRFRANLSKFVASVREVVRTC